MNVQDRLHPLPANGRCSCGATTLTLVRDNTEYWEVEPYNGTWSTRLLSQEFAVRLYCTCGKYFEVPEGI